jgi:hypothetical protein
VVPLASGKDATVPQGTKFTVLVDGHVFLKRESFATAKDVPNAAAAAPAQTPEQ